MKSDVRPPTKPVSAVAVAQTRPQMNSVRRAPQRSPSHPPRIWKMAYVTPKDPITWPSCPRVRCRSRMMSLPAVAMFWRFTYVMKYIRHNSPRTMDGAGNKLERLSGMASEPTMMGAKVKRA
jgi:hypothetical protein